MRRELSWRIWRPLTVDDGAGGQAVTMSDVGSARGDVRRLAGRELIEAQQAGAEHTHSGYFRARADIARNDELRRGEPQTPAALDLSGASGTFVQSINRATLNIPGRLWLAVDCALDDWTPAAEQVLIAKYGPVFSSKSYRLAVTTAGEPRATISSDGVNDLTATGGALGFTDGTRHAVGVEIVPNDGAGNRTFQFYTAPVLAGPWTPFGALITQAGAVSLQPVSAQPVIGSDSQANAPAAGLFYAAEIRSGSRTGQLVADPDFTTRAAGTYAFLDSLQNPWATAGAAVIVGGSAQAQVLLVLTVTQTFPEGPNGRLRVTARSIEGGG